MLADEPQDDSLPCGFFIPGVGMSLRPMALADLDQVMAIERSSFPFPWSTRFFLEELRVECARSLVVEIEGRIVGYVLFWLLPDEIDIHNVAVHCDFRRHGIGRVLLEHVVHAGRRRKASQVTLEVRESNIQAQRLYESIGFMKNGIRKGYYADNGEDALVMVLPLER
jgi:ribosomal-protein-alanine N-acetyltransferase